MEMFEAKEREAKELAKREHTLKLENQQEKVNQTIITTYIEQKLSKALPLIVGKDQVKTRAGELAVKAITNDLIAIITAYEDQKGRLITPREVDECCKKHWNMYAKDIGTKKTEYVAAKSTETTVKMTQEMRDINRELSDVNKKLDEFAQLRPIEKQMRKDEISSIMRKAKELIERQKSLQ
jgi:hypothetical protein